MVILCALLVAGCSKQPEPTSAKNEPTTQPPPGQKTDPPKPPANFPPDDWTHKELASYLEQKGVKVGVRPAGLPFTSSGKPVSFFHEGPDLDRAAVVAYLFPDVKSAREQASSMGEGAFAFGRFAIGLPYPGGREGTRDVDLLKRIAAALR
jgi:hypothetical protein